VVLVLPGARVESVLALLVEAARAVRERRPQRFALVQGAAVAASFARVVFLEHVLDTCVIGVEDQSSLAAAREEAESTRGFEEVLFDARGIRRVPVLRLLEPSPGPWPLDPGDVVLVTGGGKGIGAECALALARARGLAAALMGRSDPAEDEDLARTLRRFEAAGIRHVYARADIGDAAAVRAAVQRAQEELGPVRGILHAAGVNAPALLADVDEETFRETLRPKVGLANVLDAVDVDELGLVVGFGSIIGALGLRGEAHYALANEWLRGLLEELGRRAPRCRVLDVEWSVWAAVGMGERLGTVDALARAGVGAIAVDDGVALLEELVRSPGLPTTVVAAGRFGLPATVELERREPPLLRFLERPRLEYPGVELVAEAELSTATDPYLADHVLDGVPLLPAVVGLEAMAQAAAALQPEVEPGVLEAVELTRPVTVPADGSRRIRLAALRRRDGAVDVVLRSDESGFQADHFRVTVRPPQPVSAPSRLPRRKEDGVALRPDDVYDPLLFHGPRFRRLRGYRVLRARSCVAEVEARPEARWFGDFLPPRLVLGDPGVRDAFVHVLQACIPGTRVLPVAVEQIRVLRPPDGLLVVSARERADDGETLVWDVEARDSAGCLVELWEGLRLRRIGTAFAPDRWPAPLLAPYLERRLADIAGAQVGVAFAPAVGSDAAIAFAAGRPIRIERRADGKPEVGDGAVSAAHVDGLTLAIAGPGTLACDLEEALSRGEEAWRDLLGRERLALAGRLATELGEQIDLSAARVWAAAECARKAGRPAHEPLVLDEASADGWTLLRAGRTPVATYAARVEDVEPPLAFAFLIGSGR
jgi:enediyne polyketide synthase